MKYDDVLDLPQIFRVRMVVKSARDGNLLTVTLFSLVELLVSYCLKQGYRSKHSNASDDAPMLIAVAF